MQLSDFLNVSFLIDLFTHWFVGIVCVYFGNRYGQSCGYRRGVGDSLNVVRANINSIGDKNNG